MKKPRADKYEEKVKFEGTSENLIKMADNTKPPKTAVVAQARAAN